MPAVALLGLLWVADCGAEGLGAGGHTCAVACTTVAACAWVLVCCRGDSLTG